MTGTPINNRNGRAVAMIVLTPIRPGFARLTAWGFALSRTVPILLRDVHRLSFIYFARWGIFRSIPYNGPPQRRERLRYSYVLFESNFDGEWSDYIDAFAAVVPWQMRSAWSTSFGFPGPRPPGPMKEYIARNEFPVDHFYSAYPHASVKMAIAGLRVRRRYDDFCAETADLAPAQFGAAYRRFVRANQADL